MEDRARFDEIYASEKAISEKLPLEGHEQRLRGLVSRTRVPFEKYGPRTNPSDQKYILDYYRRIVAQTMLLRERYLIENARLHPAYVNQQVFARVAEGMGIPRKDAKVLLDLVPILGEGLAVAQAVAAFAEAAKAESPSLHREQLQRAAKILVLGLSGAKKAKAIFALVDTFGASSFTQTSTLAELEEEWHVSQPTYSVHQAVRFFGRGEEFTPKEIHIAEGITSYNKGRLSEKRIDELIEGSALIIENFYHGSRKFKIKPFGKDEMKIIFDQVIRGRFRKDDNGVVHPVDLDKLFPVETKQGNAKYSKNQAIAYPALAEDGTTMAPASSKVASSDLPEIQKYLVKIRVPLSILSEKETIEALSSELDRPEIPSALRSLILDYFRTAFKMDRKLQHRRGKFLLSGVTFLSVLAAALAEFDRTDSQTRDRGAPEIQDPNQ